MDGNPVRIEGTGMLARCLQHETDHLEGLLYVDRLPAKQRKRLLAESADHPGVGAGVAPSELTDLIANTCATGGVSLRHRR